jgi:hypothetical protein
VTFFETAGSEGPHREFSSRIPEKHSRNILDDTCPTPNPQTKKDSKTKEENYFLSESFR